MKCETGLTVGMPYSEPVSLSIQISSGLTATRPSEIGRNPGRIFSQ